MKNSRRSHNGSIFAKTVIKRGKKVKVWDVRIRRTDADGNKRDKTKRCYSYAEAQIELARMIAIGIEPQAADAAKPNGVHTFFDLCDYYEEKYLVPVVFVGDKRLAGYRQDLKTLKRYVSDFKEYFGNVPLDEITYETCRGFAIRLATTPVRPGYKHKNHKPRLPKPATVNRPLAYLHKIFAIGTNLGKLKANPMDMGDALINKDSEEPRSRILEYDEEARLLAACEKPDSYSYERNGKTVHVQLKINRRSHLKPALIFALETGMRVGEICSTMPEQVDFDLHIIRLNAKQTKALKRRVVPMSERLEAELRILFAAPAFDKDLPLFGGVKGFDRAFQTARRIAGIENLTFHDIRHTATTWLEEAEVDIAVRRNIVGHESDRTHQRYNNMSGDVIKNTIEKMNRHRKKVDATTKG